MRQILYVSLIVISLITGVLIFISKGDMSTNSLIYGSLIPFFLFVMGVHGLLNNVLEMKNKLHLIIFPVIMGMIYVLLLFIHLFLILPTICPDFGWW